MASGVDQNTLAVFHFLDTSYIKIAPSNEWLFNGKIEQDYTVGDSKYTIINKNGYISCHGLNLNNDFTIDCWTRNISENTTAYNMITIGVKSGTTETDYVYTKCTPYLSTDEETLNELMLRYQCYVTNKVRTTSGSCTFYENTPASGLWWHFAFVYQKSSNTIMLFVNGNRVSSSSSYLENITFPNSSSYYIKIGGTHNQYQELRISNVARWTANFETPSEGYAIDDSGPKICYNTLSGQKMTIQTYPFSQSEIHIPLKYNNTTYYVNLLEQPPYTSKIKIRYQGKQFYLQAREAYVPSPIKQVDLEELGWIAIRDIIRSGNVMHYLAVGDTKQIRIVSGDYQGTYNAIILHRNNNNVVWGIQSTNQTNIAFIGEQYGKITQVDNTLQYNYAMLESVSEYVSAADKKNITLSLKNSSNSTISKITLISSQKSQTVKLTVNEPDITILTEYTPDIIEVIREPMIDSKTHVFTIRGFDNGSTSVVFKTAPSSFYNDKSVTLTVECNDIINFTDDSWTEIKNLVKNPNKDFANYYNIGDKKVFTITDGLYAGTYTAIIIGINHGFTPSLHLGIFNSAGDKAIALVSTDYGLTSETGELSYNIVTVT